MRPHFAGASLPPSVGDRRVVYLPTPAAGQQARYTLPSGAKYLIDSFSWLLTTSAQVEAARRHVFGVRDGDGNTMWQVTITGGVKASVSYRVSLAPGLAFTQAEATFSQSAPLPELLLPDGWSVGTDITGLASEDQVSQARLVLQEFYDYQPGQAAGQSHPHEHRERVLEAIVALVHDGHGAPAG